jgi:hypothetical protein
MVQSSAGADARLATRTVRLHNGVLDDAGTRKNPVVAAT